MDYLPVHDPASAHVHGRAERATDGRRYDALLGCRVAQYENVGTSGRQNTYISTVHRPSGRLAAFLLLVAGRDR